MSCRPQRCPHLFGRKTAFATLIQGRARELVGLGLLGLFVTLGACIDNGEPPYVVRFDHGVESPDMSPDAGLSSPILDRGRIPTFVCGDEVGIIGRASPGVMIIVQGGASASGVVGNASPTDGRFCVPVKLRLGEVNNLKVLAQDPVLGLSKPAMIAVKQEDCQGSGEFKDAGVADAGEASKNIALGLVGKSKDPPKKGNVGLLTDGKVSTWVLWEGRPGGSWYCEWCDYGGWVMLTFEKLFELDKIVVRWRDSENNGTAYGVKYKVLYTAVTEPPDPNLDDGYWTIAKDFTQGDGGEDLIELKSSGNPLAKHVALWFGRDNLFRAWEQFAVNELEVWNKPKSSTGPPPPPANVCQGY